MSEMVVSGSKYTDEQRREIAVHYAITGSVRKTSEACNVPPTTISSMKGQDWWDDIVATVRSEKTEQMRADYVRIVQAAQEQTLTELPNATAQQAATVGAIAFDKVRLIDNAPTRITSSGGDLRALAQQFVAIHDEYRQASDDQRTIIVHDGEEPIE